MKNKVSSMQIPEKTYIDRCRALIESRLNLADSENWKQRDYDYLSNVIFEETNILLSVSTLKRIWKKGYDSTPHPGTLNALATFLGYKNWHDFKRDQSEKTDSNFEKKDITETAKIKLFNKIYKPLVKAAGKEGFIYKYRIVLITLVCILGGSLLLYAYFKPFKSGGNYEDIVFESKYTVSNGVPNSVIFNYDITGIDSDSIFIQQSWNPQNKTHITKENEHHTSVYYYPGFHKAKLLVDNKIIKEHHIHITTDGWLGIARYSLADPVPFYLPTESIMENGRMYVSPETLEENKVGLSKNSYYVSFYNVRDYGNIEGDNFTLETQVKNDLKEGGLTCQHCRIIIMCENGRMYFSLANSGCISDISLRIMGIVVGGRENDLSSFGCDLSEWNDVRFEVEEKIVKITLNDKLIYQLAYEKPAGRIIGLHYLFFGCGAVNFVKLSDNSNKIVYENQFDS